MKYIINDYIANMKNPGTPIVLQLAGVVSKDDLSLYGLNVSTETESYKRSNEFYTCIGIIGHDICIIVLGSYDIDMDFCKLDTSIKEVTEFIKFFNGVISKGITSENGIH